MRHLNLHEYQSKNLMESYKINTQKFEIAETLEKAGKAAKSLGKCLKLKFILEVYTGELIKILMKGKCTTVVSRASAHSRVSTHVPHFKGPL